MPLRTAPGASLDYYLVCVDKTGAERSDDPHGSNGRMIPRIIELLSREPYTDIFLMSHGWMGDVPAAIRQYDRWIGAMAGCTDDVARAKQVRSGFKPLLVGLHWPSLPYGDEEMASGPAASSFSSSGSAASVVNAAPMIERYADRIADTLAARAALDTIFAAAAIDAAPLELPREVAAAYRVLDQEAGLGAKGPAGGPASDREPFDPDAAYEKALDESEMSFGGFGLGPVLSILQNLSFFKMKDRARAVGEKSAHPLLKELQAEAKTSGRDVRFHLMGHSFGCIVMSAMLAGTSGQSANDPVHSAFLAQGAVSFWSYCSEIPHAKGNPGYFHSVIGSKRVTGALLTTQSIHDTAVCKMYPLAVGVRGDIAFAPGSFPKYGALGAFGARGPDVNAVDLQILEANQSYNFVPGTIYNIECSRYIAEMQSKTSGAHNDIAHPEVAHAMWSAVLL